MRMRRMPAIPRVAFYTAVGAILLLALGLRMVGHEWDQGWYLHPDERFIAIVLTDRIHQPKLSDLGALLDPGRSPLNPRSDDEKGKPSSFAYGSLPLYVTDFSAWVVGSVTGTNLNTYGHIGSVGRYLTAVLDVGTVLLVIIFATSAFSRMVALLAGLLTAMSVMLVQLAHFFTVDAWVTFFAMATLVAALRMWHDDRRRWPILAGIMLGAALATKVSVVTLGAPILAAAAAPRSGERWPEVSWHAANRLALGGIACFATFALFEPYALLQPTPFLNDAGTQWTIVTGHFDVPFTRQFVGTIHGLYQLDNLIRWGVGPALGIAILLGVLATGRRLVRSRQPGDVILASWIVLYFIVIASADAKFLRYVAPIVPALVILAAVWLVSLLPQHRERLGHTAHAALAVGAIVVVVAGTGGWAAAFESIYRSDHTRVAASDWIYRNITPGSTITAEYWDDALPLPDNGRLPSAYKILTLDLYADRDNQQAVDYIATALDQADYIILSSNRLASSIPRLPWRYPVVSQYYQLLEAGQLGFELVYEATDYPRLGPFVFPDQSADESFRVYDHPQVRIYKKVTTLSRPQVDQRFAWARAQPWSPTREPPDDSLLLGQPVSQRPAAHDLSWSQSLTHHSLLAAVVWLVALALLGLVTLPITLYVFQGFADVGWGFARLVGLLVGGYAVWILVSLHLAQFDVGRIILILALVALASWYGLRRQLRGLLQLAWQQRRTLLATEAVFLAAFAIFLLLRAINPDLWQTYFGGEKPMEMAYTNAIARSATFPPYDPWYSGGVMNYYYYGFYLVAMLWKITGIPPEIGFQLAIATVAAFLASGMFSLVSTLTSDLLGTRRLRGTIGGGLVGVVLFLFVGNLDAMAQIVAHRNLSVDFWAPSRAVSFAITEFPYFTMSWADLHPHAIALPMSVLLIALAYRWIRGPGSVTSPSGGPEASADRLSAFCWIGLTTIVIGSIAVTNSWDAPIAGCVVAAALVTSALRAPTRRARRLGKAALLGATIAGGAWLLFRPFFSVFVVLVQGIKPTSHGTALYQYWDHFGIFLGIVAMAGLVLTARRLHLHEADPVHPLFGLVFGLSGYVISLALARNSLPPLNEAAGAGLLVLVSAPALPVLTRLCGDNALPTRTTVAASLGTAFLVGALAPVRATAAFLLVVILLGVTLWYRLRHRPPAAMAAICLTGAAGVTLGADLLYVVDDLSGSDWERMNTVFKFYLEGWTFFAIAASVSLIWLVMCLVRSPSWQRGAPLGFVAGPLAPNRASTETDIVSRIRDSTPIVAVVVSLLLMLAGFAYPAFATESRLAQSMPGSPRGLTLDGLAWMRNSWITNSNGEPIDFSGDYAAIQWLRRQADQDSGVPVILEASIGPYRGNGSRISAATGLPDVLGWDRHERQQRYSPGIDQRLTDVRQIYQSTDPNEKWTLLRRYDVRYIIVGDVERLWTIQPPFAGATEPNEYYADSAGLETFKQMIGPDLRLAFQSGDTTIYEVTPFPSIPPSAEARSQP